MVLSYMSGIDDGQPIYATYLESVIQSLLGKYVFYGLKPLKFDTENFVSVINDVSSYNGTFNSDGSSDGLLVSYDLYKVFQNTNVKSFDVNVVLDIDNLDSGGKVVVDVGYNDSSGNWNSLGTAEATATGSNTLSISSVTIPSDGNIVLKISVNSTDTSTYPVVNASISNVSIQVKVDNANGLYIVVSNGVVVFDNKYYSIDAQSISFVSGTSDRLDVVVVDYNDGSPIVSVVQGTRSITLSDGTTIPITDRINDNQIPIAVVKVRANATDIYLTDVKDVRSSIELNYTNFSSDIVPSSDNVYNLGSENKRWKSLYAVDVYAGDIVFENLYRISEYDDDGNLLNGIRILDNKGNEIFKVTNEGIWFKGNRIY